MAKRRSPYEIDPPTAAASAALRNADAAASALKKHKKKQSKVLLSDTSHTASSSFNGSSTTSNNYDGEERQRSGVVSSSGGFIMSDAEQDVMNAVDAKLAALASGGSGGSNGHAAMSLKKKAAGTSTSVAAGVKSSTPEKQPPQQQQQQMSIEALEQKKMLLPYLDKIEYINYQLQMRGLLPSNNDQATVTHQQDSQTAFARKAVIPEAKPPLGGGGGGAAGMKALVKPNVHASNPVISTDHTAVFAHNQEDSSSAPEEAENDLGRARKRARVSSELLRARYPRLFETIQEPARLTPRLRPITWLLKLVEDVYDAIAEAMLPSSNYQDIVNAVPSEAGTMIDASPRPESSDRSMKTSSSSTGAKKTKFTPGKLALPLFTRRFLHHTLGLPSLADQDCLDLIFNMEATREKLPQVALFCNFLRELFDGDALLFFLLLRSISQSELNLQLSSKEKLARTSSSKKYMRGDLFEIVSHPLIPDGTKQVVLSENGCESILRRLFTCSLELQSLSHREDKKIPTPFVLAQYLTKDKLLIGCGTRPTIEVFFGRMVDNFREVSEDIVAQFKYNDDGESLTSLIRLRDTISCDSKIDKMLVHYSDQERMLRNLKIEFMKMERAASNSNGDNKFRTQLVLLQNRIRFQEQDLQQLQSEISATEARVNDVWREVVQPQPVKKRAKLGNLTNSSSTKSSPTVTELASVLGRFEYYIVRLQKKHDIEVKASALLAKPWKQQMEELKLRMVIHIQRAYRARKHARETKAQALEKVRDNVRERDLRLKNEAMDQKRLRALHEKDMQRHQTRLQAKKAEEELAKAEIVAKQNELLRKLRDEEIAQRNLKRSRQQRARAFKQWQDFVVQRRKKWQANKLFVKFKFAQWKHHFAAFKNRERAAIRIQKFVKAVQRHVQFRRMLNLRIRRSRIAKKHLAKMHLRKLNALFNHWCSFTLYNQNLKANFQATLLKRTAYWFQQWIAFIQAWKQKKVDSAKLIQRVYRGRIARQVFRYQRIRHQSALSIQRVYCGHKCRVVVNLLKQIKRHQTTRCAVLLQRIKLREVHLCFCRLKLHADWEHAIKRMARNRRIGIQICVLDGWTRFVHRRRAKRAAFLLKQYESGVLIQQNYRRHRCQKLFHESIVYHRAAIVIQRVFRGFEGQKRAEKRRWECNAAIALQSAWRKHRAKKLAEAIRTEKILLGAFKGDYSATKRAIGSGFWYVADQEGNGILHMAAAVAHKRLVKLCLRNNFDINAVNKRNQTPLHLLLTNIPPHAGNAGAIIVDDDEEIQRRADKVALAAYMIDHGAWHEAPDQDGFTPLLLCSVLGQTDAVEMLLEREANTDARSFSGGLNAVQLATEGNYSITLQALLASRGFDYDQNMRDTVRLLHACAGRGLIDCLRVLITHIQERFDTFPANVLDTADDEGYTPLIYALSNGFVDIVQCLLESNAGPDVNDYFGRSPLHFAVGFDDPLKSEAMVKLLTMYEADVNVKDNDGDAPLHLSSDCDDCVACTSLLLTHGALICSNALGNHPTHIAARHGAVTTLKVLVQYGGDMNLKNYEGKTPLGMARMHDQKAVVQHITHYFAQEALVETGDADAEDNQALEDLGEDNGVKRTYSLDEAVLEDLLQDDEGDADKDSNQLRPREMTPADWQDALKSGYWMGKIAEWTQYIDTKIDMPFYVCESVDPDSSDNPPLFTWDPPPEFEASLGEDWRIVRTKTGGSMRKLSETNINEQQLPAKPPSAGVQYFYHNKLTDEVRTSIPPINYSFLQDIVQNSKRQKMLRAKVHKVTAADTSASAMEYMRFFHAFEEESAQTRAEIHAAIKIQRHFRTKRTNTMLKALLHENRSALNLQRAFRGRKARQFAAFKRKEHADATTIQALWRGFAARRQETLVLYDQRVAHLRCRVAALKIQRLFRGWTGRKACYRAKVVSTLGPKGYFAWEQLRQRSRVVHSFKVWDELNPVRDFPGVLFYCHQVTRTCSWEKPKEWVLQDRLDFEERSQLFTWGYTQQMKLAAVRLQWLWRARLARISFQMIIKAVQLMQTCEQEYLEEPMNLVKMGNYVLYLHTITHDYERARPLYGRLMRMMAQRGPDVPFILLSYGLFLYVTQEEDSGLVEEMILRGKLKDPQLIKYKMAFLGFFRQAMVQNPLDAESNLNYAACVQWLYEHYDEATKYYLRAIAANPHKKGSMELFQEMLNRKRQVDRLKRKNSKPTVKKKSAQPRRPGGTEEDDTEAQYDGYEVFRRWQAAQAQEEDLQRRRAFEAAKDASDRVAAVRKIQARFRRRLAMRKTNRLKVERQMGASIVELAKQKVVYDKVVAAFDLVSVSSSNASAATGTKAKSKDLKAVPKGPLSIPIVKLDALFQNLSIGLSDDEVATVSVQFRETHPKLQNVNVMDICQFAEANPVLNARVSASKAQGK